MATTAELLMKFLYSVFQYNLILHYQIDLPFSIYMTSHHKIIVFLSSFRFQRLFTPPMPIGSRPPFVYKISMLNRTTQ